MSVKMQPGLVRRAVYDSSLHLQLSFERAQQEGIVAVKPPVRWQLQVQVGFPSVEALKPSTYAATIPSEIQDSGFPIRHKYAIRKILRPLISPSYGKAGETPEVQPLKKNRRRKAGG